MPGTVVHHLPTHREWALHKEEWELSTYKAKYRGDYMTFQYATEACVPPSCFPGL